ncbi:hypothetical protein Poly24_27820 [Rosistilla carotiformis]|uniref:DinB superfamily protein n=1 Tax=Rosistilla carotiformis TaxID=2528017 RepID=A0A518JU45_9BACT|nr:hypothetical protein Poly24_27820 [Rosistilla carotiformis]
MNVAWCANHFVRMRFRRELRANVVPVCTLHAQQMTWNASFAQIIYHLIAVDDAIRYAGFAETPKAQRYMQDMYSWRAQSDDAITQPLPKHTPCSECEWLGVNTGIVERWSHLDQRDVESLQCDLQEIDAVYVEYTEMTTKMIPAFVRKFAPPFWISNAKVT